MQVATHNKENLMSGNFEPIVESAPDGTPSGVKKDNNSTKIIVGVLVAVVVLCCVIPFCVMGILTLMAPEIGNVFSDVVTGLEMTPVP